MATATKRRRGATTKAVKPAPVEDEIEELEVDEDEEIDEEPEEKPARKTKTVAKKKTTKKAAPAEKPAKKVVTNGTQWLAEFVNAKLGTSYKPYDLRVLLRKMAKNGDLEREVGADRSRYDFSGENDPIVKAVLKKLKAGELDREKKASLEKLKASKGKGKKAAVAEDDDEVDEELTDDEDVDELEDEDEE